MANIPTYGDLYTSIITDLQNKMGISSLFGKITLSVYAAVQAGKLKIYYLFINSVQNNVYPDLADDATLLRFGNVRLGRDPFPSEAGVYDVDVTGQIGAVIPSGSTFQGTNTDSTSPGKIFVLDSAFTFLSTSGTISLRSLELGTDSILAVSDIVQATSPLLNADDFGTVSAVTTSPTDGEDFEQYRSEILESFQIDLQGGARTDYRIWASDVSGVREVYPYVKSGESGVLSVYVESTIAESTDGYGTPPGSMITDVESVFELDPDTTKPINERGRRPLGVFDIEVSAIVVLDVDINITGLTGGDLVAIRTAIDNYLTDIRPYIAGADDPNYSNKAKLYASTISGIVLDAIGGSESFTNLTVDVDGTPVTVYEFTGGDIPFLININLI